MSTYYYVVCRTCKTMIPIWARIGGVSRVAPTARDNPDGVESFLEQHIYHDISFCDECAALGEYLRYSCPEEGRMAQGEE